MTDREAQIEALWTYEISTEKILRRAVKKGFISQSEADEFSEKLFEQLDTKRIPGFLPSPLREKMCAEDVRVNPYISITEIAREKKTSSPSYLIQSWMRSNTTIEYLRIWEKLYNPQFQENACNELIQTVHTTGTTLTPSLWINTTHALGMRTSRGKGGGTTAHPEIGDGPDRKFCVNADKLSSRKEEQLRGFFGLDTGRLNSAYPPVFRGEKRYARAA